MMIDEDVLFADGFEEAFLGIGEQFNTQMAVYDREKCIEILMRDMSREEAEEYFDFNVQGAYVGPKTPLFLTRFDEEMREELFPQEKKVKKKKK